MIYKKIRVIFSSNPVFRRFLNLIFTFFRTQNLNKELGINNSIRSSPPVKSKKLLIAGSVALNPDSFTEYVFAEGLKDEYEIFSLKCDSFLKSCFNCKKYLFNSDTLEKKLIKYGQGLTCSLCKDRFVKYNEIFPFTSIVLSKYLSNEEIDLINKILAQNLSIEQIKNFQLEGINVGKHAYAGCVRYYANPFIEREKFGLELLKNYFESALKVFFAYKNITSETRYDLVIVNHGIYVPQGIIAELSNKMQIKTLCFATGYRKNTFMVSKGKSYHFDIPEIVNFEEQLSGYDREKIYEYLQDRRTGKNDWILFHETNSTKDDIFNRIIKKGKNNIVIFTNVLWDADVHFDQHFFPTMVDWLIQTINYLIQFENNNIIIRIHPGEKKGFVQSRVYLFDELKSRLQDSVYKQIVIIDSDDDVNSYDLATYANHNILYGSKLAIELAALGFKILIGGPSWTFGKGITVDPTSKDEYYMKLNEISHNTFNNLNVVDLEKALRFAYYIFFNRCIEISIFNKRNGDPPLRLTKPTINSNDIVNIYNYLNE